MKSKPGMGSRIDGITYRNITGVRMGATPTSNPNRLDPMAAGAASKFNYEGWRDIDIDGKSITNAESKCRCI